MISPFTPEEEFALDGVPLMKQLLADQEMMNCREEAVALQFKEAKARLLWTSLKTF